MDKLDLDEIMSKNPNLDRESLDALRKYLKNVAPTRKTRYRLAPLGAHPATIGMPDPVPKKSTLIRGYPGFKGR